MTSVKQIIGFELIAEGSEIFHAVNPATGNRLQQTFIKATAHEVDLACVKSAKAFQLYRKKSGREKAVFLESVANEINALGSELTDICCLETALPRQRIEGERARTVNQLLMFAKMLREGSWVDARIETADPYRSPLPKPDLRFMHIGIGPVAVFGASNFPLAFSVAGGDTASALAAGCPVIVKVHELHPGTSDLVGRAIQRAAKNTDMPDGVFSMIYGDGPTTGIQLVNHAAVSAVAMTGSFKAGRAIFEAANKREIPIPVYAEMGSTNPVFILPGAVKKYAEKFSQNFAASVTLGVGQFCTNPGLLLYEKSKDAEEFVSLLKKEFEKTSGGVMLSENIRNAYVKGLDSHANENEVSVFAKGLTDVGSNQAGPVLFRTTSDTLNSNAELAEEVFGPTSMLVESQSKEQLLEVARNLKGHLTATVHGTEQDLVAYEDLLDILAQKVGRIVINGFPTGVEVSQAMVHGGPYPATMDGRSTSVGTSSVMRFVRPICFQGMPQELLPLELKNENPIGIWRMVDGMRTTSALH